MASVGKAKTLVYRISDFDLTRTLTSGQTFGWMRAPGARGVFSGEVKGTAVTCCEPRGDWFRCRVFKGPADAASGTAIADYFDLERDYSALARELTSIDPSLAPAVASGRGLRMLRQDPWEALISFIISAHNNVPRIQDSVLALKARFGAPLTASGRARAFPSAGALSEATEEDLVAAGLGFRSRYVKAASSMVAGGVVDLTLLNDLSADEARLALVSIPGVGRKVADCVLLYAYRRTEVFPVDVWVKRAVEALYFGGEERPLKYVMEFAADRWGPYAGFVQLYLYDYFRRSA